jgi:hypothetical protein
MSRVLLSLADDTTEALKAYARMIEQHDNGFRNQPFSHVPSGMPGGPQLPMGDMLQSGSQLSSSSALYPPVHPDGQPTVMHHSQNDAAAINGTPKPGKAVPNQNTSQASGSTPGPSAATPAGAATPVTMTPVTAPASLKRKANPATETVSPTTSTHESSKRASRKRTRTQTGS